MKYKKSLTLSTLPMALPQTAELGRVAGPRGGAVRLNGRDQYVRVSGPLAWTDCGRLPFTLAAWVRTTDSGTNAVLYRKAFAENPKFELDMEDGKARFRLRNRAGREFRADSDGAGSFTTEQAAYWHIGSCVELAGQTLGLIGCGHIGRLVAEMAGALGMDAVAYDIAPREDVATAPGFRYAPLDDVLRTADFLSLHCPAMPCCRPSCSSRRNSTRPKSITRASSGQKLVGTGRMGGRRQLRPGAGGVRGHCAGHAGVRQPRGNLNFRLDSTFVE